MKVRRRVRVQNEKSKYRFSKQKVYKDRDNNSYFYEGKNSGGVFQFLVVGNNSGSWSGYERDLDMLNLQER